MQWLFVLFEVFSLLHAGSFCALPNKQEMLLVHTGMLQILGDSFMTYGTKACSCSYKHNTSSPLENIRSMHCRFISFSDHLWPAGTCTRHALIFSCIYMWWSSKCGETQQFQTSTLPCFDLAFQVTLWTCLRRAEFQFLLRVKGATICTTV